LKKLSVLFTAMIIMAFLISCGETREANKKGDPQAKVLATVNDVPITQHDMQQRLKRTPHGEMMNPEAAQNVLQALVRDELIYQKSLELGLDKNPEYRKKLQEAEAQLRAFQRQEISALYRGHMRSKVEVKDAEAQDYFEKNSDEVYYVEPGYKLFKDYYIIGVPPIAMGVKGKELLFTYVKPCHGCFVLRVPGKEEVEMFRRGLVT